MEQLDNLAYKLLGPGSSGITLLVAGLLLVVLVALLGLLLHMHLRFRTSLEQLEPKLKKRTRFSAAPRTQISFQRSSETTRPRSSWARGKATGASAQPLSDHHIDLDDPFLQGGHHERRSSYRRAGNPVAVSIVQEGYDSTDAEMGVVLDRSAGGLGLEVNHPMQVGTLLKVRPTKASVTIPWVDLEVRHCRVLGTRYHVGCQFLRTPSWDVMMAFG